MTHPMNESRTVADAAFDAVPGERSEADAVQSKPDRDGLYKILEMLLVEHNEVRAECRQLRTANQALAEQVEALTEQVNDLMDDMRVASAR